jgi:ABC-type transport system substrate-binding protein
MKQILPVFVILLSVFVSACAPGSANSAPPEVATTLPENIVPPGTDVTSLPPAVQTPSTITMADKGKTFTFHVGDSFLLNLGGNVYDWTVTVDNQDVIALKMGVMVIRGAQGIFDALIPGTAILTATGDPLCRKSKPPCMMPTILFRITVIVQ